MNFLNQSSRSISSVSSFDNAAQTDFAICCFWQSGFGTDSSSLLTSAAGSVGSLAPQAATARLSGFPQLSQLQTSPGNRTGFGTSSASAGTSNIGQPSQGGAAGSFSSSSAVIAPSNSQSSSAVNRSLYNSHLNSNSTSAGLGFTSPSRMSPNNLSVHQQATAFSFNPASAKRRLIILDVNVFVQQKF